MKVIIPSAHPDAKVVSGERFSRKERWFCAGDGRKPRLCPEGTFQVGPLMVLVRVFP